MLGKAVGAILAALVVAGCATGYQPVGLTGGYDEVRLSPDTYRVSVQGNGYTSGERAYQIMLLRAAELTLANGFAKFAVVDEDQSKETQLVYTGLYTGYSTISRPNGSLVVKMLPADTAIVEAMDAETIRTELYPRFKQA